MIGLPYANIGSPELKEKMKYLDSRAAAQARAQNNGVLVNDFLFFFLFFLYKPLIFFIKHSLHHLTLICLVESITIIYV